MRRSTTLAALSILLRAVGAAGAALAAPQPIALSADAQGPDAIHVTWNRVAGASGYRLLRNGTAVTQTPGGPPVELPPEQTDYNDRGLSIGTDFRYTLEVRSAGRTARTSDALERTELPLPIGPAHYDVIIVQASSGGVAAAIAAAKRGLHVALIESTGRLGGMPVNGLSATDLRRPEHLAGFLGAFRDRVKELYRSEGMASDGLRYEPRIAHEAMKSLLFEQPGISVYRYLRFVRTHARHLADGRASVREIVCERVAPEGLPTGNTAAFTAGLYVDATDCGDLAAAAGARFRLGREAGSRREPHNGIIYYDRASDKRLRGSSGAGDRRIQAYAYLVTVKDYGPGADRTILQPPGYRREDYVHTPAWKDSWAFTSGRMPNNKFELNQHPQGTDLQEVNYGYPAAGPEERVRIDRLYRDHALGYLYYIQTEQGQKQIGLPDDEYRSTNGFPPLLYVREGRRIVGLQTPDEADVAAAGRTTRPESVGLGDYPMDSHAVRRKTDWSTPDMGEGEWWLYRTTPVHQIPIGIMIPADLDNVVVTTAVSSTHVSFGTYRMEPVRMQLGESAGILAALALHYGLEPARVPFRQVQEELLPRAVNRAGDPYAAIAEDVPRSKTDYRYRELQFLAARGIRLPSAQMDRESSVHTGDMQRLIALVAARRRTNGSGPRGGSVDHGAGIGRPSAISPGAEGPAATRRAFALQLASALGWAAPPGPPHYSDISGTVRDAAEALLAHGIRTDVWDGPRAMGPGGSLLFRPDELLTPLDFLSSLYKAQLSIGPLFYDHPAEALTTEQGGRGAAERVRYTVSY